MHVCAKTFQSCPTLCNPMDCSLPDSSVLGESPGTITGVGHHALLQGIFLAQEWNSSLLHYRWILSCLSHQGSSFHPHRQLGIEPTLLMGIGAERSKQSSLKEPTV